MRGERSRLDFVLWRHDIRGLRSTDPTVNGHKPTVAVTRMTVRDRRVISGVTIAVYLSAAHHGANVLARLHEGRVSAGRSHGTAGRLAEVRVAVFGRQTRVAHVQVLELIWLWRRLLLVLEGVRGEEGVAEADRLVVAHVLEGKRSWI